MSTNLFWAPVTASADRSLPKALKYIIARRLWDHDGSLSGEPVVINASEVPYLEGIRDATSDTDVNRAARQLIEAIIKHGTIELSIRA